MCGGPSSDGLKEKPLEHFKSEKGEENHKKLDDKLRQNEEADAAPHKFQSQVLALHVFMSRQKLKDV